MGGSLQPQIIRPLPLRELIGLFGDDLSNPALGPRVISLISRDQMHVQVKDTLPSRLADIDANVVPIGLELFVQGGSLSYQQLHAGAHLFSAEVEEIGTMP
jgi:hypothetical protein